MLSFLNEKSQRHEKRTRQNIERLNNHRFSSVKMLLFCILFLVCNYAITEKGILANVILFVFPVSIPTLKKKPASDVEHIK